MADKKIDIIIEAHHSLFTAAMDKGKEGLHSFTEKAGELGEKLKGSFENMGSMLSQGTEGIAEGLSGMASGLAGLVGQAGEACLSLGPVGIAIGVVLAAASAGALAVIGLGMAIKSIVTPIIEAVDNNYKLANGLGVTVASLQTLQIMAKEEAGVAVEDFNGILQKLAKNLGTAASEGGPAAKALGMLGLEAGKLGTMGLDSAFSEIAEKLSEVKNPAERAMIAVELFGKTGAKLLPMFSEGAEGIENARKKLESWGVLINQGDAATLTAVKEKFEEVGDRIDGIKNQLTVALGPYILKLADGIMSWIPPIEKIKPLFQDLVIVGVAIYQTWMNIANAIGAAVELAAAFAIAAYDPGKALAMAKESKEAFLHGWLTPADGVKWMHDAEREGAELAGKAGKDAGNAFSDRFTEGAKKIQAALEESFKGLQFQMFLHGSEGQGLREQGLKDEQIKKLFDAKQGGADSGQLAGMKGMDITTNALENLNKEADAIRKKREEYLALISPHNAELALWEKQIEVFKKAQEAQEALHQTKQKLITQIEAMKLGLTGEAAALYEKGIRGKALDEVQGLEDQKKLLEDAQKAEKDLAEDAKKSINELPMEKLFQRKDQLDKELAAGLLSDPQYDALIKKANADFAKASKDPNLDKKVGAEESRVAFKLPTENRSSDPMERAAKAAEAQLKKTDDQYQATKDINNTLKGIAVYDG